MNTAKTSNTLPIIVVTAGEPASIAPDICIKIAQQNWQARLVFLTDPELIVQRAEQLGIAVDIQTISKPQQSRCHKSGSMQIMPLKLAQAVQAGKLNQHNSAFVLQSIRQATQLCLQREAAAMVTPPVHKGIINDYGLKFSGHTEFIAEICQATPVMMLASKQMRVALVTTHLPLKDVASSITAEKLKQVLTILLKDLKNTFALSNPCVLVCGLNPHAGEDGHLGREEIETITPVINEFRQQGFDVQGPFPADTLFNPDKLKKADAVLSMYHDQGLPVLKYASFGEGINITLGLDIIRVSVDHGTALDLAGSGQSNPGSMHEAVKLAIELANKKRI